MFLSELNLHGSGQRPGNAIRANSLDFGDIESPATRQSTELANHTIGESITRGSHLDGIAHIIIEHDGETCDPELYVKNAIVYSGTETRGLHKGCLGKISTLVPICAHGNIRRGVRQFTHLERKWGERTHLATITSRDPECNIATNR